MAVQLNALNDTVFFTNIAATTAAFTLRGGQYGLDVIATFGGGNVTLQRLAKDDTTWVTVLAPVTTAGYATVNLPGGTYRFSITTATAVYIQLTSVVTAF